MTIDSAGVDQTGLGIAETASRWWLSRLRCGQDGQTLRFVIPETVTTVNTFSH
jgi:hypothetical protein